MDRTMRFQMQVLLTTFLMLWVSTAEGDTIRLVIFAGQSNIGLSTSSSNRTELSDVEFQYNLTDNFLTDDWIPLQTFGPNNVHASEISFGVQSNDALNDEQIAIIKISRGGTNLSTHWNATSDDGLYVWMIDFVKNAIELLEDDGHTVEPAAFVWIQGSGDSSQLRVAQEYDVRLTELIGAVRTDLGAPDLPIIFNQFHVDSDRTYKDELRASQARFAATDDSATMINIDDMPLRDSVHWARSTHIEAGYRLSDAFVDFELARNASVSNPEPSTIVLAVLALISLLCRRRMRRPTLW